ncbi:MAG: pyrroline-5-carboxylate reductase [Candidatus Latescibacteria bacterium]|nr:pyrroline-5-carboxylate reductase [Candidatus Latescibacterota bacterium]
MRRIAIIGAGNMGQALTGGILDAGFTQPHGITITDVDAAKLRKVEETWKVNILKENQQAAEAAQIIILAVKPGVVRGVLKEIAQVLNPQKLLISVAAGITISSIEAQLPRPVPVVRVMPNMPALIRQGISAICWGKYVKDHHIQLASEILSTIGDVVVVKEAQMDGVTGLSGSGPAYVFTLIEALSDGGVKVGLPRKLALRLAVQTVIGAAKMAAQTGGHPAVLREQVTSPGGTTIAGLHQLEAKGFRDALISAVEAAAERSRELRIESAK